MLTRWIPRTRWQAFAIHLSLSALIAATLVAIILFLWYPAPYFQSMGGRDLLALMVGVDVVLGPAITLIIYRLGKKGLAFDLAVIAVLQVAALVYGAYIVFEARPVFTVYSVDRFESVVANAVDPGSLARTKRPEFASLPLTGPRLAGSRLPTDPEARTKIMFDSIGGGPDIHNLPEYYVPYEEVAADAVKRAKPLSRLRSQNTTHPDELAELDRLVAKSGRPIDDFAYLPLSVRTGNMSVVIDAKTGAVLGMVALDPWW
jgi:hypothetical protein